MSLRMDLLEMPGQFPGWNDGNNYVAGGAEPGALDLISGTAGTDNILGLGGDDALSGLSGDDWTVGGGKDDDTLDGGEGADQLWGGAGNDMLEGGRLMLRAANEEFWKRSA